MTALTRDTSTTDQVGGLFAVDEFDPETAVAMLADRDFDPTRVRLTGLRTAEWSEEAACAGHAGRNDDPWHPGPDGETGRHTAAARTTCRGCPVRAQCLALGLALLPLGDVHGMYGGYSPSELRTIARGRELADRKVAQHGTRARSVTGCTCTACARAHADYYREQRAEDRWAETTRSEAQSAPATPPVEVVAPLFEEGDFGPASQSPSTGVVRRTRRLPGLDQYDTTAPHSWVRGGLMPGDHPADASGPFRVMEALRDLAESYERPAAVS
jgi:hypothetical protein